MWFSRNGPPEIANFVCEIFSLQELASHMRDLQTFFLEFDIQVCQLRACLESRRDRLVFQQKFGSVGDFPAPLLP